MDLEVPESAGRGSRVHAPARWALGVPCALLVAVAAATDLPRVSQGEFWGDGATYFAMAWSLARDGDVRWDRGDLERVLEDYPGGPQGLFLKRASGGLELDGWGGVSSLRRARPEDGRLYFAKAIAYPLVASPFVRLFGSRGLPLTNALVLALALWLGHGVLVRRGFSPWSALALVVVLVLCSVAPVYLFWPTPELFGLGLVTGGLAAWASGRPLLSAALFGVAGYVKWPSLLMAAPLGFAPIVAGWSGGGRWRGTLRGARESLRRGAVMGLVVAALFGLNVALTGEVNYQGGERKTFYDRFPFDDRGTSFDGSGFWMTTDQVGPLVAGGDDARVSERTGPARARVEIWESLFWNLGYYWVGRFGGALGYFGGAAVALLLFFAGPRSREGGLALLAVLLSALAYIWIIPDNWYGGGGTVGNRYFLNLLPAFLFIVPRGRERWVLAGGALLCAVFLGGILASPVHHSRRPGEHAASGPYKWLPAELTMLNDLSVFTEPWRKKRPFGFVGNAERHADASAYNLYFMDDGTFGKETWSGDDGFWVRGARDAEVVLRVFDIAPITQVRVRMIGGPIGDVVTVSLGWSRERVSVGPGQRRLVSFRPGRGLRYYDTYLHVLRFRSLRGAPLAGGRSVGAFVSIELETGPPFAGAPR